MLLFVLFFLGWRVVRVGLVFGSSFGGLVVRDELRGWVVGALSGGSRVLVRPSELASPCPVRRDVWLVRGGLRLGGGSVSRGCEYHREVLEVFRAAVSGGWGGLRGVVSDGVVRSHAGVWALSVAAAWLSVGGVPPLTVEPSLPPVLGFTGSKPDLVVGSSPVEVAYASAGLRSRYVRRKRVELAAYALILEALTKAPVNLGWLVVITDDDVRVEEVPIDEGLREEALRAREEVEDVISSPNPPPLPTSCPPNCPLRSECLGAEYGGGAEAVARA